MREPDDASDNGWDAYLFPEPSLQECTNRQLYRLIRANLPYALDQTDGTDLSSDVTIDHAQDLIEQARDVLISRGEQIPRQLGAKLSFLSWPLRPEELAEQQARRLRELEADRNRRAHAAKLQAEITHAILVVMEGGQLPADLSLEGVTVEIGWGPGSPSGDIRTRITPSGADVLHMRDALIAAGGECRVSGAAERDIAFEKALTPTWSLYFSVPSARETWDMLKQWWHEGRYQYAPHVWIRRPEIGIYDFFWHWSLDAHWPAQAPAWRRLYGHLGYLDYPWVRFHRRGHGLCWDRDEVKFEWAAGGLRYIECTEEADREALQLLAAGEILAYEVKTPGDANAIGGNLPAQHRETMLLQMPARVWGVLSRFLAMAKAGPTKDESSI
ncbi:hypothetical protein [Ralstonia pseudosolanacearum]|uniref:hypothetical protein n=1 Tax=Ralstonia pseudosolanacearum TaxID=1310165 RepID=UPI003CF3233B